MDSRLLENTKEANAKTYFSGKGEASVAESRKKDKRRVEEPTRRAMELTHLRDVRTDPLGSYTGSPLNPYEKPVQDADDL